MIQSSFYRCNSRINWDRIWRSKVLVKIKIKLEKILYINLNLILAKSIQKPNFTLILFGWSLDNWRCMGFIFFSCPVLKLNSFSKFQVSGVNMKPGKMLIGVWSTFCKANTKTLSVFWSLKIALFGNTFRDNQFIWLKFFVLCCTPKYCTSKGQTVCTH